MAKAPVTRIQLDAYRFGQRRLESALALRDPVLLHEQIRTQRRIVAIGVVLSILMACGLMAYIHLSHKDGWVGKSIVVNGQSGQMFVVIHQPDRLVPVPNLAAARLVLAAASDPRSGLTGLSGSGGSGGAEPVSVQAQQLAHAQVTPQSALYGAPGVILPGSDAPAAPQLAWAMCNDTRGGTTSVIDGVGPTTRLGTQDGVVVANHGNNYLITGNKSYRIGPGAAAAYDLKDAVASALPIADSVLALIPPGNRTGLTKLSLGGAARSSSDQAGAGGLASGAVVRVDRLGQGEQFYVFAVGSLALVSEPVAKLLRIGRGEDISQPAPLLTADQVNAYPRGNPLGGLDAYPPYIPRIHTAPVVCWQWDEAATGPALTLADWMPAPPGQPLSQLAKSDGAGPGLDQVALPSGVALDASAVPGADPNARQGYWLVAPNGVAYPIADRESAQALGLTAPILVPVDALNALAQGPPLSLAEAKRTVDVFRENPATGSG